LDSASDAASRAVTGKNPGADLAVLTQLTQGVRGTTFYPALTITTGALPGAIVGTAYQAALQASAGASPHKGWWLEADPARNAAAIADRFRRVQASLLAVAVW